VWLVAARAGAQEYASQTSAPARIGLETVASAGSYTAPGGGERTGALDLSAAWKVSDGVQMFVRPVLARTLDGEWQANVYEAALRYERPGRIRVRFEGGYLPSPVGILPLESRADQNPLITPAQNYDAWLPFFERGTPWVQLTSGLYPLAAMATAATGQWDLRGGVLGSSSARTRPLTGDDKPPSAPQLSLGGGITPHIGLRLGASFEHGVYARADELKDPATGDRRSTLVGLDADYSVRYTHLYADWIQGTFERATGDTTGRSLTVTGVQTLSPRWYAAARLQHQSTTDALVRPQPGDAALASPSTRPDSQVMVETVAGYRLTADITLKAGYNGTRSFGSDQLESHAVCSIVWTRRWR
jgi:hypothetical protein